MPVINANSLALDIGFLFFVILAWFLIYYWLNPQVNEPDGQARVTGQCGDVMEVRLKFESDHMVEGSPWTNGCVHSLNCIYAAVDLARGKTPEEILDIDPAMIRGAVGGLPRDHWHCAGLAAETLHAAIDDYMQAGGRKHPIKNA